MQAILWRPMRSRLSALGFDPNFRAAAAARVASAAYARQQPIPVIGFLHNGSPEEFVVAAFRQGLKGTGYIDGQSATIEYRWAGGQYDQTG